MPVKIEIKEYGNSFVSNNVDPEGLKAVKEEMRKIEQHRLDEVASRIFECDQFVKREI